VVRKFLPTDSKEAFINGGIVLSKVVHKKIIKLVRNITPLGYNCNFGDCVITWSMGLTSLWAQVCRIFRSYGWSPIHIQDGPNCSQDVQLTATMIWTRCNRKWVTGLTDAPSFEPIGALVVQLVIKCRKLSSTSWTEAIKREVSVQWEEDMTIKWKSARGTGWTDALGSSVGALVVYWCRSVWSWRSLKVFSTGWTDGASMHASVRWPKQKQAWQTGEQQLVCKFRVTG
jgi:hypothetical protein